MKHTDYLHPLTDERSRDEFILIEFKNFLRNYHEVVINKMLSNINTWIDKYPLLEKLIRLNYDEVYNLVTYSGINEVLFNAGEGKISISEIEKDINTLIQSDIIEMSTRLQFQSALVQILDREFVKKVYIQCESSSDEIVNFIKEEYFDFIPEKLHLLKGTIEECYDEHPELTSIFLDSADNLLKILKKDTSVKAKSFILNDCKPNNHYLDNDSDLIKFERKHSKEFESAMETRCCFISYMYSLRVQNTK